MVERSVSLIHILLTTSLLSALVALFRGADPAYPDVSVYHTYHLCALAGVGLGLYYLLYNLVVCASPAHWGLGRRVPAHLSPYYTDASEEPAGADLVVGYPRLTMESVWGLVYGLGIAFAVLAYCFAGQQAVSFYFLTGGLSGCCVWEAIEPGAGFRPARHSGILQLFAMLLASSSVLVANVEGRAHRPVTDTIAQMDLFSLVFGVVLPCLAPCLLCYIRINTKFYRVGSVLELCEFGLPFLLILVFAFLSVGDAPYLVIGRGWVERPIQIILGTANATLAEPQPPHADEFGVTPAGFWLILLISPLLLAALMVIVVAAVVRGHAGDPLVGVALVVVAARLIDSGGAHPAQMAFNAVLVLGALVCRCLSTGGRRDEGPGEPMIHISEQSEEMGGI